MNEDVDLKQLAIDRGGANRPTVRTRRHLLTRYVLPLALMLGFLSLVAWSARDLVFPPRQVTVVPVISTTATVREEGIPLFKAAGWIEPRPTPVRVAALAPGVVEELKVVEDQAVKEGEPVAVLVKDDAKLAYDRAVAELKLRQAELEEAQSLLKAAETRLQQPVHLQAKLGEAEATLAKIKTELEKLPFQVRRAVADLEAAQKDYHSKIGSKGVVADVQIDIAKSKFDSSKALVDELQRREKSLEIEEAALTQRRNALKTQLKLLADENQAKEGAQAQVDAAAAKVELAQVVVSEAKLRLDRMTVRSPIDGRVFRLIGHPGATIGGATQMAGYDTGTVVTLYRPDMLQVRVDVRFEDIPKVSLNQPVRIENPAISSALTGKVLFVSSEADIQKNTLQVKVEITDPPDVFKPEMLVDVTFLAPKQAGESSEKSQELHLYLPKLLIHQADDGAYVWLADQSAGVARKTSVKTGPSGANGLVQIVSGLNISSRIISHGSEGLQDGERIKVTSEDFSLGMPNGVVPKKRQE